MYSEQNRLERRLYNLRQKAGQAQQEWEKVSAFLAAQGLKADMPQFPALNLLLPAAQPDAEYHAVEATGDDETEVDLDF